MKYQTPKPRKPDDTASFEVFIKYYSDRKEWSQKKLAKNARIEQANINKLFRGKVKDRSIDMLVCICLALQINLEDSVDLLARAERAFSPASSLHKAYKKLISYYADLPFDKVGGEEWMIEADEYLKNMRLPALPNCDK